MEMLLDIIDYHGLNIDNHGELLGKIGDIPKKKIVGIAEKLCDAVHASTPEDHSLKRFDFLANHFIAGYPGYTCSAVDCREKLVKATASFATMYSDTVYLPNYFNSIIHSRKGDDLYYEFYAHIRILNSLRPAIEAGYIRLLELGICQDCLKPYFQSVDSQFTEEIIQEIENYYLGQSEGYVERTEPGSRQKNFLISSPLFYDHDSMIYFSGKAYKYKTGKLSREDLKKTGYIREAISQHIGNLRYNAIASNLLGASYITNHEAQEILYQGNFSSQKRNTNDALKMLFLETPIFENVSLDKIVEIRKTESESFDSYRQALNKCILRLVGEQADLTPKKVQEYYNDTILSEVNKLDRKIRLTRKALINKTLVNATVVGLGLGACLSLGVPSDIVKSIGSITYAGQTLTALYEAYNNSPDSKLNDYYFLWKVSREKSARLNTD